MLRAFIDFVVHRRLVALCATLAIAIYGIYAYLQTAIEAYPDVTNVQVGIIAQAPGLAPEEVERQITQPLERELNGTPRADLPALGKLLRPVHGEPGVQR